MKKIAVFLTFFCLFTMTASAGQYILPETGRMEGNLVKGEDYIQNDGVIVGDGIFFCKTLNGGGAVGGDLLGVFGTAKIGSVVGGDLRCFAGGLYLDGNVAKNITAFGGTIQLRSDSVVGGGVYLAGGEVSVSGTIGKTSYIAAREVIIDGKIDGDLHIYTGREGKLYINAGAEIGGAVYYHGTGAFISPDAHMADYQEYSVLGRGKSPLDFTLTAVLQFLIMALLSFVIHFLTRGFFFRCGEKIHDSLRGTAKSFFWLLLFLLCSLLCSAAIYFLIPFGLPILFCGGISLLFCSFLLFLYLFSVFPVACLLGRLMTKKDGFFTMLLGYFLIAVLLTAFEIAALFEPLAITATIFLWAIWLLLFLLGGGSIFLVLFRRIKSAKKRL